MNEIWNSLVENVSAYVPNLLAALAVLVLGWILALLIAALVKSLLGRTSVDNRLAGLLAGERSKPVEVEKWASRAVFYFVMLLVLIAFFHTLKLEAMTQPLQDLLGAFLDYVPSLVGGILLLLIAWVVATLLRRVAGVAFKALKLDERLGSLATQGEGAPPLSKTLTDAIYWITFLVFLPAILGTLELAGLLDPVNEMMREFFAFLPNLIASVVTLLVGWFLAKLVQRIVSTLLASVGTDQAAARWGLDKTLGQRKLSDVVGMILQFVILIPVLIAALEQLQLASITQPATSMLTTVLEQLPVVVAAAFILIVAWVVGRVVAGLVQNLLAGLGFNQVLVKVGLSKQVPEGRTAPAAVAGTLLFIAIMLAAGIAAAETLGFNGLAVLTRDFITFAGEILLGLIIFGLGLVLAQIVFNVLHASDSARAKLMAWVARVSIIVLIGAMALRATGVADSIVNLAFGALVCGVAAAGAIAFGLGGRRFAADQLARLKDPEHK